jgi:hypothetical protein
MAMNKRAGIISDVEWWEEFANLIANQQRHRTASGIIG